MVDQRFHRALHLAALGRHHLAVEARHRPFGHLVEALLHDARRLAHFLDAHHEPVIAVEIGANRNVEVHAVIDVVGLRLANVPGNAGAADHRAGKAPFQRVFLADHGDVDVALLEDAVVDHQAHRILEQARQAGVEPVGNVRQQLEWHILMHAAGPEIGRMHARARCAFEEVEAILANFEQPQVGRHRAHVHHMAAKVQHVIADAREFREEDAQILRAQRHFQVQQLFDRQDIAMLHAERRAIVEPVEIGQRLQIGLVLDQLFGAAVQQADMRVATLDDFAVQLHDEAQNAVRRGVLRTEVDRVILDLGVTIGRIGRVGAMVQFVQIVGHYALSSGLAAPLPSSV